MVKIKKEKIKGISDKELQKATIKSLKAAPIEFLKDFLKLTEEQILEVRKGKLK